MRATAPGAARLAPIPAGMGVVAEQHWMRLAKVGAMTRQIDGCVENHHWQRSKHDPNRVEPAPVTGVYCNGRLRSSSRALRAQA